MANEISHYFESKLRDFKYCISLVSTNLFSDFAANLEIVTFPFLGIKECFGTTKYGYLIFNIFLNYLVSYITSCIFYFYCIFPLTCLIYSLFFGPAGFLFALAHGAIFCNIIACHETRVSSQRFMNSLFTMILAKSKDSEKLKVATGCIEREKKDPGSWRILLLAQSVRITFFVVKVMLWFTVSLIPVFGNILLKIHSSGPRGFSYFLPYFKFTKRMDNNCMEEIYYKSFGRWLLLGLATGLLESVPVLAGLTVSTNTCGSALWELSHYVEIEDL